MVNRIFIFFLLVTASLLSCNNTRNKDFVYTEGKSLMLGGEKYFPIMINYVTSIRLIDNQFVIGPSIEYDKPGVFESRTEEEAYQRMKVHFKAIKQMGFNAIRFVGLNPIDYEAQNNTSIAVFDYFDEMGERSSEEVVWMEDQLLSSMDKIVDLASEMELRLMVILPRPRRKEEENRVRLNFIEKVLKRYNSNPTIFSYDFFNEPIYFDNAEFANYNERRRDKRDAKRLVSRWKQMMQVHAPSQLLTIGFSEPIEVFEWDPSILDVDFVSIHTYHPLRVPNEIYWFSNHMSKPWLISETSLPAENDSISYEDQAIFMTEALQRTIDCGGAGFGWWQYQEVKWGPFEHNYTAMVDLHGETKIGDDKIFGTIKPAAKALASFDFSKKGECNCHVNYYNMLGFENYLIKGEIVDYTSGEPIEGAVIRAWNRNWRVGINTFSNENGEFNLYSNDESVHFEISAPGMNTEKFDLRLKYDTTAAYTSEGLSEVDLEYHKVHFQKFLKEESRGKSVFDFDPKYFDNSKLQAKMKTIRLREIL